VKIKRILKNLIVLILLGVVLSLAIYGVREFLNSEDEESGQEIAEKYIEISDEESFQKGITMTPKSFEPNDFMTFLGNANEIGNIITWTGSYTDLLVEGGGPETIMKLTETRGNKAVIIFSVFETSPEFTYLPPIDETQTSEIHDALMNFVGEYKPQYIALGNEINLLYQQSPEKYDQFVENFSTFYDEIKEISPDTQVFIVFQLEKMKGLNGGLYGGEDNEESNSFYLADDFEKADFIAFTTYPGLIYKNPEEIPDDYYSSVVDVISTSTPRNIIYSEVGWSTSDALEGWESSQEEQVGFIDRFWTLNESVEPKFVIWSFMFDQEVVEPFNKMGLIEKSGAKKSGWDSFLSK